MTANDNTNEPTFADHVRLIMKQDGIKENKAKFRAWCEGPKVYAERLEQENDQ